MGRGVWTDAAHPSLVPARLLNKKKNARTTTSSRGHHDSPLPTFPIFVTHSRLVTYDRLFSVYNDGQFFNSFTRVAIFSLDGYIFFLILLEFFLVVRLKRDSPVYHLDTLFSGFFFGGRFGLIVFLPTGKKAKICSCVIIRLPFAMICNSYVRYCVHCISRNVYVNSCHFIRVCCKMRSHGEHLLQKIFAIYTAW